MLPALLRRLLRARLWSFVVIWPRPEIHRQKADSIDSRGTHLFALARGALEGGFVLWTFGRILKYHIHVVILVVGLRHDAEVVGLCRRSRATRETKSLGKSLLRSSTFQAFAWRVTVARSPLAKILRRSPLPSLTSCYHDLCFIELAWRICSCCPHCAYPSASLVHHSTTEELSTFRECH